MLHPEIPPRDPWHLCGHRAPGDDQAPQRPRRHRRSSSCPCTSSCRTRRSSTAGLSNYWGYNTIGFLAPHNAYAAGGQRGQQVLEFKAMVKALHAADIEVILDVVYNHTAEGNHMGPTLAYRGLDNNSYYRLVSDDLSHYYDTTGTGNSLLMRSPHVAAAHHGLAALLGDRDARRRLPLRPRGHAGPPVPRGRQALGLLRPHPAGPRRQPGEAHRRALGRRRGRLPGRQLPAAVDRVERQVPRHRPRLLAGRGWRAR